MTYTFLPKTMAGAVFMAVLCLLSTPSLAKDKFKAVTTFTVIADIARNVAGEAATVESITKPGAEIHDYQPTPQDIVRAQGADIIFWNGLNLSWFARFLQDVGDVPRVVVSEGITPLSIYEGPYSGKPNPHAWMSTENALIYVENIRKAFARHDPVNAALYNANAAAYSAKIRALQDELAKALQHIPAGQLILSVAKARLVTLRRIWTWKRFICGRLMPTSKARRSRFAKS